MTAAVQLHIIFNKRRVCALQTCSSLGGEEIKRKVGLKRPTSDAVQVKCT